MKKFQCTFTGVDEQSDFSQIIQISQNHRFVEWGILLSTSENKASLGSRYPNIPWIFEHLPKLQKALAPLQTSVALHVCGKETKLLLEQSPDSIACQLLPFVNRVQINFVFKEAQIEQLETLCKQHPNIYFITQHNHKNENLHHQIKAKNHQILFDSSGGNGIRCTQWLPPLKNKTCGYAGGLGPETITKDFLDIIKVAQTPFWIDMENKIRTNDLLDLSICSEITNQLAQNLDLIN